MAADHPSERPAAVPDEIDPLQVVTVAETDPKGGSARPAAALSPGVERGSIRVEESIESYQGLIPVPPPYIIAQYEDLKPGAAEKFFEFYAEQAAHRRRIEASVVETNNSLALRGQLFAAGLGFTGLVGSFIVVGLGQGIAGATIATGCLVALTSVFLRGQQSQNRELDEKAAVQAKIRQGTSEPSARSKPPTSPSPSSATVQKSRQRAKPQP